MSSYIRIGKTCLNCGEIFIAKTTVTKYCSDECAKRAYKLRKRQDKLRAIDVAQSEIHSVPNVQSREYLSIADACRLLGASRWTIYRMIDRNYLKAGKLGRRIIIQRTAIENLFQS